MAETAYYTTLKNRGLVRLSGPDARHFLQGLITNDINLLDRQPIIYACLLTPQGKFMHDFFITEKSGVITLDCEGGDRAQDLFKKLSMYKLRADVTIECVEHMSVYAIFSPAPLTSPLPPAGGGTWREGMNGEKSYLDPRNPLLGFRTFEKPDLPEKDFEIWDRQRILLAIPDGSRDMIPGQSTLLESNIDQLNGISFEKGCYLGQELTARMHYRALVKKRLQTVKVNELPEGADLRSTCGDVGMALIKIDQPS